MSVEITENTTINEITSAYPNTLAVFSEFQVDSCCGGGDTLSQACEKGGQNLAELIETLKNSANG